MGLPFDWHQRPARVMRLSSGARPPPLSRTQAVAALLRRHGLMQARAQPAAFPAMHAVAGECIPKVCINVQAASDAVHVATLLAGVWS